MSVLSIVAAIDHPSRRSNSSGCLARASASFRSIRSRLTSSVSDSSRVNDPCLRVIVISWCRWWRAFFRMNALHHLHQEITITRRQGSFTLEESLTELVKRDLIDRKEALARARHPEEFERLLG